MEQQKQQLPQAVLDAGFPADLKAMESSCHGDGASASAPVGPSWWGRCGCAAGVGGGGGGGGCSGRAKAEAQELVAALQRGEPPAWA
eukprot:SAG11_NODE_11822_length_736_cov_1.563579_1_plen_86_part_01